MKTLTDEPGRERSFVSLYEQHYGAILAYARRRVEESAARDVTADVFLVAWRRLDEAVGGGLPWLYRTAQLTLKNSQRAERRSVRTAARLASLPAQAASPDPAVTYMERQQLLAALSSMPEKRASCCCSLRGRSWICPQPPPSSVALSALRRCVFTGPAVACEACYCVLTLTVHHLQFRRVRR